MVNIIGGNKMKKIQFEQDILNVLKKYGYKTEGIKNLSLRFEVNDVPEVDIEYFII